MIYATADANPCIPIDNLSTAHKHYGTYTNLCSTIKSTLETCCNLSTATDLQHSIVICQGLPETCGSLAANRTYCLRNP